MKAESCGAQCSICPLKEQRIVYPEKNVNAKIAIVSDHPGQFEVKHEKPLIGPTNRFFSQSLSQLKMDRGQFHITMSVLCQPPSNNMHGLLSDIKLKNRKIQSENKRRSEEGLPLLELIKTPQQCCEPRLKKELDGFDKIISMGSHAVKSVLHESVNVMDVRGAPTVVEDDERTIRVVPTLHPSMVGNNLRWSIPFLHDMDKAIKWFNKGLDWEPPKVIYHPSASELESFLFQSDVKTWAYDVETDGIESLTANLRCIGIGTADKVVIIGFKSIDGHQKFYKNQYELDKVVKILKKFFRDSSITKMGWNSGYYDRLVIENHLGITPQPHTDAMLLHNVLENELPHSLGFAGSMYSEAPSWKTDRQGRKKAYGSETDFELHEYCAYDVAVTFEVYKKMMGDLRVSKYMQCIVHDESLQKVCVGMHKIGMLVDKTKRFELEMKLTKDLSIAKERIYWALNMPDFNPGSSSQLRTVFFDSWGLLPKLADRMNSRDYLSALGQPSVSDDVLKALLTIPTLSDAQRHIIVECRKYKRIQRELKVLDRYRHGGCIHLDYNLHSSVVGKITSTKIPNTLKSLIVPDKGNVFVEVTLEDLKLRVAVERWQNQSYIDAFKNKMNPHSLLTAPAIFGKAFEESSNKEKLIALSKVLFEASWYGESVERVYQIVTQTEVDNEMPYANLSIREVRMMHNKLMNVLKFEDGWQEEIEHFRRDGYLVDPILGRPRDFLDGENILEIVKYPIEAGAASLMATALVRLHEEIAWYKWGPRTGIVHHDDDKILIECAVNEEQWVHQIIEDRVLQWIERYHL